MKKFDQLCVEFADILKENLPENAWIEVEEYESVFDSDYKFIRIAFAASGSEYNYPQMVSLRYDPQLFELETQVYGGYGGSLIYRIPDENHKYLALQSIKIPFRKPKPALKNVKSAIKRFAERWLNTIIENKDVLHDHEHFNYNLFHIQE